ncbi:MAG: MBOAT family protein, partial [Oscillospiraceae bacterium]|nr:MBOAT family protein [Oscillospiraceae bacterium]
MTLNSLQFFILITLTVIIYYCLPNRGQKAVLLIGGYVFYMWLRPVFGGLLLGSTVVSYFMARGCAQRWLGKRTLWIVLGAAFQLGILFVFKYFNFFMENVTALFGVARETPFLKLALPIGISFFTFSITSYLFDVHAEKTQAEKNFLDYAVFVAFFPTLLSGPIGRARDFLPQMKSRRDFSREGFKWGLLRFLWGMLQKVVVADTLAIMVNAAYSDEHVLSAGMWIFIVVIYSLQLYLDFAGYSNMAIGAAKMLGITVMENFRSPFFSTSVRAFWKKWHISFTSWLKEYIYFPLGGSRRGKWRTYYNILVVYVVSGLWHGAAWTYVVWAFLNGLMQVVESLCEPAYKKLLKILHISEKNKLLLVVEFL